MIKRITAYETSDGKLLRSRQEVQLYEGNLLVKKKVTALLAAQLTGEQLVTAINAFDLIGYAQLRELFNIRVKTSDLLAGDLDESDENPALVQAQAAAPVVLDTPQVPTADAPKTTVTGTTPTKTIGQSPAEDDLSMDDGSSNLVAAAVAAGAKLPGAAPAEDI